MKSIVSLTVLLALSGCSNRAEEEIVVVPKGYTGYVLVIFNQANGAPPSYQNKKRIYEIPPNGILRTQFTTNDGWRSFTEFYRNGIELINRIPSFAELSKVPKDTISGLTGRAGSIRKNSESKERIEFMEFFVGTKAQIEQFQERLEKLSIVTPTE